MPKHMGKNTQQGYYEQGNIPTMQNAGNVGFYSSVANVRNKRRSTNAGFIVLTIVMFVVGLLAGAAIIYFTGLGGAKVPMPIKTYLTEGELSSVVGTYVYDGRTYEITAREALENSVGVSSVRTSEGTYQSPTADQILACARNEILQKLVEAGNITPTEQQVQEYMASTYGSDDISAVAAYYQLDESQAMEMVRQATAVSLLRKEVTGGVSEPYAPSQPSDGDSETANQEYARYIQGLLGSHWDSVYNRWADTDNPYYAVLENMVFTADSANYEAAQAAYTIAYEEYLGSSSAPSSIWSDYVNEHLGEAAITISTLRA